MPQRHHIRDGKEKKQINILTSNFSVHRVLSNPI